MRLCEISDIPCVILGYWISTLVLNANPEHLAVNALVVTWYTDWLAESDGHLTIATEF